jgi:hypothetical protein
MDIVDDIFGVLLAFLPQKPTLMAMLEALYVFGKDQPLKRRLYIHGAAGHSNTLLEKIWETFESSPRMSGSSGGILVTCTRCGAKVLSQHRRLFRRISQPTLRVDSLPEQTLLLLHF